MLALSKGKLFLDIFRTFHTTSRISTSHYDVLGVTPKATQSDIKSAYYKLSKLYHPDKSKDEESAKMFRAITEAYEVLGNISLKKMYDKGLLVGRITTTSTDYKPEDEPADPTLKFYKSRGVRHVVPTIDGRTPIYDFDTWSKEHYGNLLKKNQDQKEFVRKRREKRVAQSASNKMSFYSIFVIATFVMGLMVYARTDYDIDTTQQKNTAKQDR